MGISPYLAGLRKLIGHRQVLLPSVSVVLVGDDGRILLVRHAGDPRWWGVPGGAVEIGETPEMAAGREILEEIGVRIGVPRLLRVLGGPDFEVTYANGDRVAYVTAVYRAGIDGGVPAPDREEISEVGWFGVDELAGLDLNRFSRALLRAIGMCGCGVPCPVIDCPST
ncbi:NUDIX domain-containing protein [Actinoplanes sp. G11-F43]|uniref:NUDIX domain-containing protein n=1 Tax=Actinoplanes sp. G11-F43 TaxID=3424130 RepID=UPI003D342D07